MKQAWRFYIGAPDAWHILQVGILAFVTGTLFVRTRNPTNTVTQGSKYANLLFFSLLTMQFDAFTEVS